MNRTLTILFIIVGLIVFAGLAFFFFSRALTTVPGTTSTTTVSGFNAGTPGQGTTPGKPGSGGTPSINVQGVDGNMIAVNDFKNASSTIKNPDNTTGYFILSGTDDPEAPVPPYTIVYFDSDQSFGISLNREPVGKVRSDAEGALMNELGISEGAMCNLNYTVAVGPGVNPAYDRQNLGFSFCPGAVPLPQ